jgi:hypothetical protein
MSNIANSNLPLNEKPIDSATDAKRFFNSYYEKGISIPSDTLDATVDFFQKRGFEETAASSVATVLLSQAKIEGTPIFKLLDTLKGFNDVELSQVVQEVLNYRRVRISTLGTKVDNSALFEYERRNVIV